jgi:hypothetical protein
MYKELLKNPAPEAAPGNFAASSWGKTDIYASSNTVRLEGIITEVPHHNPATRYQTRDTVVGNLRRGVWNQVQKPRLLTSPPDSI